MTNCHQCQSGFEVTDADRAFYDKVSPVIAGEKFLIPEPTLCPPCREQKRILWKNERNLYHDFCDLCQKPMVSLFSPDKPYTVYCNPCWWSDQWNPLDCGQEYDSDRSFFEQFGELLTKVPKQALHHNNNGENCEFTTSTTRNRNCYLISSSGLNEDCYYGIFLFRNRNCMDGTHLMECEACYECVDCDHGYNLAWCQNTKDCSDSRFLYDCHGARNCFFSYGLRNSEYVFRNQQLSREEYEQKIAAIDFSSYQTVEALKKEFQDFCQKHPRLYYDGQNNESTQASNSVFNSKNVSHCFDCNYLEDCKFCGWFNHAKDCYDMYAFGYGVELCYNSMATGDQAQRIVTSINSWDSVNELIYSFDCHTSQNLFGCVGLKRKQYCILNRTYSQKDYETLVSTIIRKMQAEGSWGDFFPAQLSDFGYNETMASDFYPLSKEEVMAQGWKWKESDSPAPEARQTLPARQLPDRTEDVPNQVLDWAIECEATGRPFKLLKQELHFYRQYRLPIPHLHPDERYKRRFMLRNGRKIHVRQCGKCGIEIQTTYSPEQPEIVYCEQCYLKEVY